MIFCDLAVGNRSSADIYLSTIDVKRGTAEFSLCQMVRGMVKEAGETPDYKGALDLYAEGIVFGNASDNWMPELLFRTGMAYKNTGELKASNEIFKQISVFYPGDIFSDKAKRKKLESIIYPKLQNYILNLFKKDYPVVFISGALLYEAGFDKFFDKIVYIDTNENTRLKRLIKRNNYTETEAKRPCAPFRVKWKDVLLPTKRNSSSWWTTITSTS